MAGRQRRANLTLTAPPTAMMASLGTSRISAPAAGVNCRVTTIPGSLLQTLQDSVRLGSHEPDIVITRCDRSVEHDLGIEASADEFRDAQAGSLLQV